MLERGFKSYAEGLAINLRREMGLAPHDPLCAFALAEHLAIPVLPFSELLPLAKVSGQMSSAMLQALDDEVHGLCIPWRAGRAILHNDTRSEARQQSDVSHEVAHVLLQHPMSDLHGGGSESRTKELEDEAICLGGILLVPKPAALMGLRSGRDAAYLARAYGVSEALWAWRCNASGASVIFRRRAAAI